MIASSNLSNPTIPSHVELESARCPLGCIQNDEFLFEARDRLHDLPGIFNVVQCRQCGLIRTNPRPTPETIGYYYPDDYGPYLGTRIKNGNPPSLADRFKSVVKKPFNLKTQALPPMNPGRMLEVGCASGSFMHKMKQIGWQVRGVEMSSKACTEAQSFGLDVHCGTIGSAPSPEKKYDLIVGWMVLEHLHDPVGDLQRLREWLNDGGWLVLSVPNTSSLEFKIFKSRWYALHIPGHLYNFSTKSIKKVLKAGGWQTTRIIHQRMLSNLIASCGYWLQDKHIAPKIAQKMVSFPDKATIAHYGLFPLSALFGLLGQTGRMTVWAKKDL